MNGSWRYERIKNASHWMQLDAPERINELLLEFLAWVGFESAGDCVSFDTWAGGSSQTGCDVG